jgi:2-keto-4-pentenoate hydratase/2-oxohepta-3-ene-1,7-dioic acid hydratase in catechol pathway
MVTRVNGEPRQDARGSEMTLDFRALATRALGDMDRQRFLYNGGYYKLSPEPAITPDMTLMSGTAEGVIFTQPTRGDIIEGLARWLFSAGWARGEAPVPGVIETFIDNELASGHFLQPGDVVQHQSSRLGDILVSVGVAPIDP